MSYGKSSEPPQYPPCTTLDRWMRRLELSNSFLANLCFIAQMSEQLRQCANIDDSEADPTYSRAVPSNPDDILEMAIFLHEKTLDMTHLSKFRNGHQMPWKRARNILCKVFSTITKRTITVEELFPELEIVEKHGELWPLYADTETHS